MTELFLKALIVHLVADFFLQSDWMSENKADLRHPAAWVHGSIHAAGNLLVFPIGVALLIGFSHVIIDTRKSMIWLRKVFRQNPQGPAVPVFEIWQDQAAHLIILAAAALLLG